MRMMIHCLLEKMVWIKRKRTYRIRNDRNYLKTRDVSGPEMDRKKRKH